MHSQWWRMENTNTAAGQRSTEEKESAVNVVVVVLLVATIEPRASELQGKRLKDTRTSTAYSLTSNPAARFPGHRQHCVFLPSVVTSHILQKRQQSFACCSFPAVWCCTNRGVSHHGCDRIQCQSRSTPSGSFTYWFWHGIWIFFGLGYREYVLTRYGMD